MQIKFSEAAWEDYLFWQSNGEHRLVYAVQGDTLLVAMCRYRY